jgi:hypothetical protein
MRSRLVYLLGLVGVTGLGGCGAPAQRVDCMGVQASSGLVDLARLYRVEVYGADVACAGGRASNDGAHTTADFPTGSEIRLEVPAGAHTLVLTAFADDAGQTALGSGCTQGTFSAREQICIDLVLSPIADLGVDDTGPPPTDLTPSVDLTPSCDPGMKPCGAGCISQATCCMSAECTSPPQPAACYVANGICAAPGANCSYTMKSGITVCAGGACCSPVNGTCAAGTCVVTCNGGAYDCNGASADGCECNAGSGCCPGNTCMVQHDNGTGQTFTDCVPLGTYNQAQATKAAMAFDPAGTLGAPNVATFSKGTVSYICMHSAAKSMCACWAWDSTGTYTSKGHVEVKGPQMDSCFIPFQTTDGPAWN